MTKEGVYVMGDSSNGEGWQNSRNQIMNSPGCCENMEITLGFTLWTNRPLEDS